MNKLEQKKILFATCNFVLHWNSIKIYLLLKKSETTQKVWDIQRIRIRKKNIVFATWKYYQCNVKSTTIYYQFLHKKLLESIVVWAHQYILFSPNSTVFFCLIQNLSRTFSNVWFILYNFSIGVKTKSLKECPLLLKCSATTLFVLLFTISL